MSDFAIRDGRAADCEAISRLFGSIRFDLSPLLIADRLTAMQDRGDGLLVAATTDDTPVGCIATSRMVTPHRPAPVGRISVLVVEEAWRGCGIGSALVHAAQGRLSSQGCTLIEVTSRFELEAAHRFYERHGYMRTSLRFAREL
ncbi:GNAT family N-acetyltransferase [Erythrobacter sp. 3-20A1M]|uniref:GNAT family N-acetyltransferase n=1 Tax=Erythrobacter sp. 3-20A1M TaxID=2653850 RepID=UPI001BFCB74B|nr:GNAT family N-acetyltransferase [Erythrobacter sp. 3-20A1M]QWC56627.1 GNAT family N-acetyltransferase [Erythrobacter sp. 3-20A1M]